MLPPYTDTSQQILLLPCVAPEGMAYPLLSESVSLTNHLF